MINLPGIFAIAGLVSISGALLLMGYLSRRLGRVTGSGPYYLGFYVAAALVMIGAVSRSMHITSSSDLIDQLHHYTLWVLMYNGAPALGVTLGVIVAWRYWSWLLAERGW